MSCLDSIITKALGQASLLTDFAFLVAIDSYKELIWYWYIFENRTLQDTYDALGTKLERDSSRHIQQGKSLLRMHDYDSNHEMNRY